MIKWTLIFYDSLRSSAFACGSLGEAWEVWLEMLAFCGAVVWQHWPKTALKFPIFKCIVRQRRDMQLEVRWTYVWPWGNPKFQVLSLSWLNRNKRKPRQWMWIRNSKIPYSLTHQLHQAPVVQEPRSSWAYGSWLCSHSSVLAHFLRNFRQVICIV